MTYHQLIGHELEYSLDAQAVRRSRRLQGLEPQENIAMIKQETQTKMGEYHFQPFRNPSIFTGERNQNPEKWLKEFHRVARYNCWDDSKCLANVYFFLQGTAHRWYENVEEKINSWDIFVKMFSQNFGHHVTQKDQLAENLKTRAQGKEETSDSYIQDVLHLCREVNPAMMENEIVAHLTKGISEEIYQSIIILDIASIDEFIKWCRKIEASNKKRVVFDRLPNVAAIDSADSESMEDLIRRIVREEVHRALNPESTTPEPSSLKEIIREEIEKNVAAISKPIQRPPPRQSTLPKRPYITRRHHNEELMNGGRMKTSQYVLIAAAQAMLSDIVENADNGRRDPKDMHQAPKNLKWRKIPKTPVHFPRPPYKPIPTPLQSRKN
ncbi:ASPRV1 [Cordylochernes scorpioides]|uniref:ASPRV1 n=1 Tax=Cordylochernes scorpioides TaxID=51811 RepID=A0ABY6K7V6_9ARAC|nr:ASPRV1 [Cordylochernes scorpioides]